MIERGRLVHSRVVEDPGRALEAALDRELTGHAVLESQAALLLEEPGRGVLGLREGVPVAAYHTATGRGGSAAVADLAGPGPFRVELYAEPLDDQDPGDPVEPGVPAEVLASDPALAERTRAVAPAGAVDADPAESADAVEAFLENDEMVASIRERAREEASRRAEEWGLDDLES